jgi:hypothetical protein
MANTEPQADAEESYYGSIRAAESGGNDLAKNPNSSATGRYQFTGGTWKRLMVTHPELGLTPGGRTDPDQQERAIRVFTRQNASTLSSSGIPVDNGTLYAAHFLGAGGAVKALRADDNVPMAAVVNPATLAANGFLGRMTVGDFRSWAEKKGTGRPAKATGSVGWNDVSSPKPYTRDELAEAKPEESSSVLSLAGDAVKAEWSLLWGLQGRSGLAPDPDYKLTPEELKLKATQYGVPPSRFDYLAEAHSADHLDYLGRQYQEDAQREQRLSEAGALGAGMRIGAALLDPGAWAAGAAITAATGGLGLPAFVAARAGRAGLVVEHGLEAAAANVTSDAMIAAHKPITDDNMLLWSAGSGFILGGAFGALRKNPFAAPEADRLEAVGRQMQDEAAGIPASPIELPGSAGAARASYREPLRLDTDEVQSMAEAIDTGGVFAPGARFDLAASLKGSENPLTRVLGDNLVADGVGSKDLSRPTPMSAEEVQKQLHVQAEVRWQRSYQSAFKEYADRNGFNWLDRYRRREEFGDQVTEFVRNRDPMKEFDPAVAKAGAAYRAQMQAWAEHLNDPGILDGGTYRPVKGAEELSSDKNYASRIFNVRAVDEKLELYGNKQLEALVAQAIRSNRLDDVDEALTGRVARAYVKRIQSISYGEELTRGRVLGGDDLDAFRAELEANTDLSPEEIEKFTTVLEKPAQDGAKPRLKNRLPLDEMAGLHLRNNKTGATDFVRFSDLLHNDADFLASAYNRWASGAVAMARMKVKNPHFEPDVEGSPEFLIDGVTGKSDFDKLLAQVRAIGESSRIDRTTTDAELRRLQFAYDAVTGVPHPVDGTPFGVTLRMLRDYNFVRVMNQVGFAQLPELASIAGQLGTKAMWNAMPDLKVLVRDARTGALSDELSEELELITGYGTDWLRGAANTRWDDFGNPMTVTGAHPLLNTADNALRVGKRVTSAISGMAPINTLLQRWVSRAMAAKFADIARNPNAANMNRMRSLGLSDEMLERVRGQLKAHGSFMKGEVSGKNLRRLNVEKWEDLEAASAFRQALFRGARRIIQENDVGNMAQWMSHPLARTLLQFRTFVIGSWTKQLLHNVRMNDFATYATFMGSLFAGALTYVGQTHLNLLGREDRDEQLEKRLSFDAIARGALQRSSWFSLFGPGVDTAAPFLGASPVFDARTTALSSDIVFGNPTVDLITSTSKATGAAVNGIMDGGRGTQAGVRNAMRPLPFSNFMPFVALTNAMIDGMPKYDHH